MVPSFRVAGSPSPRALVDGAAVAGCSAVAVLVRWEGPRNVRGQGLGFLRCWSQRGALCRCVVVFGLDALGLGSLGFHVGLGPLARGREGEHDGVRGGDAGGFRGLSLAPELGSLSFQSRALGGQFSGHALVLQALGLGCFAGLGISQAGAHGRQGFFLGLLVLAQEVFALDAEVRPSTRAMPFMMRSDEMPLALSAAAQDLGDLGLMHCGLLGSDALTLGLLGCLALFLDA